MPKALRHCLLVVLLSTLATPAAEVELTIFHTNDIHQSLVNLPRMAGYVADWRATHPGTLFLDAGDWFDRGSPLPTVDRGDTLVGALARMGYDAVTIGNHDWSYSGARLYDFAETSGLRFVCANVGTTRERLPKGLSATWLTELNGVKVGLFGLTLDTGGTNPKTRPNLYITKPGQEAAVESVAALRAAGAELIIALTHIGLQPMTFEPPGKLSDTILAESVPGIDVIVGGHTHTLLPADQTDALRQKTGVVVVQSGAMGQYLGQLDLVWDTDARKVIRYQANNLRPAAEWPAKPEVADWLAAQYRQLMPNATQVVAAVTEPIERYNLGAWYADFLRAQTGADVALVMRKCIYDEPNRYGPATALTFEQLGGWIHSARVTTWQIPREKLRDYLLSTPVRDRLNPYHDKGRPFTGDAIYYSGFEVSYDTTAGEVACRLPDQELLTVVTPWPFSEWYEVRTKGWPTAEEIAARPVLGGLPVTDLRVLPETSWELLAKAAAEQPLAFSRRWPEPDPFWAIWQSRWEEAAAVAK